MPSGPEVSSQDEDLLQNSFTRWVCRVGRYPLVPPLSLGLPLLYCSCLVARAFGDAAASLLWHFSTWWLVCVCHRAVTSSLLELAQGKFTQSHRHEVEAFQRAGNTHTWWGKVYVHVGFCLKENVSMLHKCLKLQRQTYWLRLMVKICKRYIFFIASHF